MPACKALSPEDHHCFDISELIPELLQIPMTVTSPAQTNKSRNKITNIPHGLHQGYANKSAPPTSLETNLAATKAAV